MGELDARLQHDIQRWDYFYACGFPFVRYINHTWGENDYAEEDRFERNNIFKKFGLRKYLVSLSYEAVEQSKSFFTHRENLDILAPYFIGCAAIASYYFNADLQELLNSISISTKT